MLTIIGLENMTQKDVFDYMNELTDDLNLKCISQETYDKESKYIEDLYPRSYYAWLC